MKYGSESIVEIYLGGIETQERILPKMAEVKPLGVVAVEASGS